MTVFESSWKVHRQNNECAIALVKRGSHGVGEITTGDGSCLVAPDPVAEEGHRHSRIRISPADRGAESAMPEGAHGAGGSGPVPTWVGQPAEFKPESAADRYIEDPIDLAVDLDLEHLRDRLRTEE